MCVVLKVCKQGALGQGVDTVKEGGEKLHLKDCVVFEMLG